MKYEIRKTELSDCLVRIDDDGKEWFIPTDPSNSDYQAYLTKDEPKVTPNV